MISVVDIGLGNFVSVANILSKMGYNVKLERDYDKISHSEIIILPGVGRFDVFMEELKKRKLDMALINANQNNSKILGICVGMHVLLEKSEEGNCDGLKLIKGKVKKFSSFKENIKIPHMGWNKVKIKEKENGIFNNLGEAKFYFIHSFYTQPENEENIIGTTFHGEKFASIINKDNIYGVQFHPEKSHYYGKKFFKNFLDA